MDLNILDTTNNSNVYNTINNSLLGKGGSKYLILIVLTIVILLYYTIFSNVSVEQTMGNIGSGDNSGLGILEIILWGLFVFLILINGLNYFFNIDLKATIGNLLSDEPEIDIAVIQDKIRDEEQEVVEQSKEEVFHVNDNEYTYDDAKAVCSAFGARLATYDEIENSYNNGGEWCSYGWSKDQLALYPTQKSTYEKLKESEGEEHSCGRPGVNGGFIANSNVKFGANCYGYKPKITNNEMKSMEKIKVEPITQKDKEFESKVNSYKSRMNEILLSPFNNNKWSQM
jgi:hypothetical protein